MLTFVGETAVSRQASASLLRLLPCCLARCFRATCTELDSHKFSRLSEQYQRSASRLSNSMFRIVISSMIASSRL